MSRLRSWPVVLGDLLAELVINGVVSLLCGWLLMLAVGVVHHEWIRQCPTIGYLWAAILTTLIRGAFYQVPERGVS